MKNNNLNSPLSHYFKENIQKLTFWPRFLNPLKRWDEVEVNQLPFLCPLAAFLLPEPPPEEGLGYWLVPSHSLEVRSLPNVFAVI